MRYVFWGATLFAALACAVFAISNTSPVDVALWPFSGSLELPLYALSLGTLIAGLVLGVTIGALRHVPVRLERRRLAQRLGAAEAEAKRLKSQIAASVPAQVSLPSKVDA